MAKLPSISTIKRNTKKNAPFYFDRKTLKTFGQTMSSFKVYKAKNGATYIYAKTFQTNRDGVKQPTGYSIQQYLDDGLNSKLESTIISGLKMFVMRKDSDVKKAVDKLLPKRMKRKDGTITPPFRKGEKKRLESFMRKK
tara:strand:- start:112 stop:528 length:417 start_codon:yes stop_codon:yes gene_type:complete